MVSKQLLQIKHENNDLYNKNNVCPRCLSNSINIWIKTKKGNDSFKVLNKISKEIKWIIEHNKTLEINPYNSQCNVCKNNSVYINNISFAQALEDIFKDNKINQELLKEFNSFFISTSYEG